MENGLRGSRCDLPRIAGRALPGRAGPPLTHRCCVSCWSCNRPPDRGGGAWTWRREGRRAGAVSSRWLRRAGCGGTRSAPRAAAAAAAPRGQAQRLKWRPEGSAGTLPRAAGPAARARHGPALGARPAAGPAPPARSRGSARPGPAAGAGLGSSWCAVWERSSSLRLCVCAWACGAGG